MEPRVRTRWAVIDAAANQASLDATVKRTLMIASQILVAMAGSAKTR